MALEPAKLSDFAIAGALGAGSTARVYDAVHTPSGRAVAIKMLEPSQQDAEARERFAREALFLADVQSRHIGKILGFGFDRGQPFLVLERLHGETLDAKLRRDGPIPLARALPWIEQLLVGIRDCHDANIIHRDIKPSNIFLHVAPELGGNEVVKVIDFGVARLKEVTGDPGGLTSSQALIGSMGYMAPEQFRDAKSVDFTADLYAIGVVVFRTLTGRLPFVSRSLDAVIRMKLQQPVPLVSSMEGMPANAVLDRFVRRAMERSPEDRFQNAREMLESWWEVMASLYGDDTDVDRRARPPSRDSHADATRRSAPVLDADEERTERRRPALGISGSVPAIAAARPPSAPPPSELAPSTLPGVPHGMGAEIPMPPTVPGELLAARTGEGVAPPEAWDQPTRTDPALRQLVERELELHRRKSGR